MEQAETTAPTQLRCTACKCFHSVHAFSVDRSRKRRGYAYVCREVQAKHARSEGGRAVHRKAEDKYNTTEKGKARNARYKLSEKGRAVHAKSVAKYLQSDKGRITRKAYDARYHANMNERAWAIIGKTCAWAELGGCSELMAKDHIVPVKRRHKSGYSSFGYALTRWIVDNPAEAKKKVQCLCEVHNWFKNDMPDDEARAKWAARHPLTQEMFEEIVEDVA